MATKNKDIVVTIAAERFLRDQSFDSPEHKERVLEEAKRQCEEVGYSIVTKGDIQRAIRHTDRGKR